MKYLIPPLAAILFYLIPTIVGVGAFTLIRKNTKRGAICLLEDFALGSLILYIQIALANFFKVFTLLEPKKVFFIIATANIILFVILCIIRHLKNKNDEKKIRKIRTQDLLILLFLLTTVIVTYFIWRIGSPPQTTLNWDIYHHQTLINLISQGKFCIVTSKLSDSFQFAGYSTIFHTLVAIPQVLLSPKITEFWFFAQFLHLLSFSLVSFAFAYGVTKNKLVALISALLGTLIFESSMAYSNLFLIPQNLAAVVGGAFIAGVFLKYPQTKKDLVLDFLIFALFAISSHLIIGGFATFLLAIAMIFLYVKPIKESTKTQNILLFASLLCVPVVYFLSKTIDFSHINRGEAAYYIYSLEKKFEIMRDIYGYGLLAFLPLGYFYALKQNDAKYRLLMIMTNGILAIIIGTLPYNLKFLSIGRLPLITLMALGIWMLIKDLPKVFKVVAILLTGTTFGLVFIINAYMYKGVPNYKNLSTHVSPAETQAAEFIKYKYTEENVLLVSEPATMHILEGLSGVNSPGGAYTSIESRQVLTSVYLRRDETLRKRLFEIRDSIGKNDHEKIILVISGRFREWQLAPDEDRYGIQWNVWRPKDLDPEEWQDHDFIYYLREVVGFEEVYKNEGLVIFEVERGFL